MKISMKRVLRAIVIIFTALTVWQISAVNQDPDIVCTQEYVPVCWMPYFECPEGALCARPMDVTYSNMCALEAAGATLQYKWVCDHDKPKVCTKEYNPVCGMSPQKACMWPWCNSQETTYSNMCILGNNNAEFLYEWVCKKDLPEAIDDKYYVWDTQKCSIIRYRCDDGWSGFTDKIWCGCQKDSVTLEMKQSIDRALENFMQRLESKNYSQEIKNRVIIRLSESLQNMRELKPKYSDIINYTLQKLDNY